ncbi:MAG TPA: glycosyltransferase family 9 protein [Ignavibacteriaceae bacterium]
MATPIIEKLKSFHPKSTIDFLLRKGNEGLLENNPNINLILIWDKKSKKYSGMLRMIRRIRNEKYDFVINVQRFASTGLITMLSGAKQKIGFDKNPLSVFYTTKIKHQISTDHQFVHEVDRNLSLIRHLTDDSSLKPRLYPSLKDYEIVPNNVDYVCIAPASVWFTKQWPAVKWIELIDRLKDRFEIFLIGGSNDVQLCLEIQRKTGEDKVKILAGKLSFLESAALIEKAKMTFANDSSPVHLASAMNAPITEIFCSTVPYFGFGPLSDESNIIETEQDLACRPCGIHGLKECPEGHFKCAQIKIKDILTEVDL